MPNRSPLLAALAAALVGAAPVALAGPLDPPAGPIAPTPGPEPRTPINLTNTPGDTDSVYKIAAPGSYYLTASFTAPAGKSAIEITASNVTIDLGGFTITSLATLDAIRLSVGSRSNISIRNGAIGTCGGGGIDIEPAIGGATTTIGGSVENITIHNTAGYGLRTGDGVVLINVHASSCGGNSGIQTGDFCSLTSCTANANTVHGLGGGPGSTLLHCSAADNGGSGIQAGAGSSVLNCSARNNSSYGFLTGQGTSIVNCASRDNLDMGIYAVGPAVVSGCIASGNADIGIYTEFFASSVTNCTSFSNDGEGFSIGGSSVVTNCTSATNGANGFLVGNGTQVINCNANQNVLDGVRCGDRCVVEGCLLRTNGFNSGLGAGVHATGSDNRIERNHASDADFGIDIDGSGNVIVRNTCSDNTQNFVINPNNIYGAIIDRTSPGTPAVIGSSAAGTMGSTDPNANFSH